MITDEKMLKYFLPPNIFTCKLFRHWQASKHFVGFPPPVMLGLSELSLSVVTMDIRPVGIGGGLLQSSAQQSDGVIGLG